MLRIVKQFVTMHITKLLPDTMQLSNSSGTEIGIVTGRIHALGPVCVSGGETVWRAEGHFKERIYI